MGNPTILVIIVTYNAMHWAKRCFDSIRQSTIIPDVFVVDNGSTDGTQQFIRKNYPEVRFTQSEENLGFGKANNIGLQYALDNNYDYVYLLNQDAWVMSDTFEKLIETSKMHPEFGVLSPMQMQANLQHLDEKFVTNVIGNHQRNAPYLVEDLYLNQKRDVYDVSFVMAAHWLITCACLECVGGFSPTFPHYGEDGNYLNRVNYWQMKIGIVPDAMAVHDRSNPIWSEEKNKYIFNYIAPLEHMSNPLAKTSIKKYIISKGFLALRRWNWSLWKYTMRIFRERKQIERNYQISLLKKAFIK